MKNATKYLRIFANLFVLVLGFFLVFYVAPKVIVYFMPFFIGYLISLITSPPVRFLEKRVKILRKHGTFIIIILVLGIVVLLLYLLGSWLWREALVLIDRIPGYYESAKVEFSMVWENLQVVIQKLPADMQESIQNVVSNLSDYVGSIVSAISGPTISIVGSVVGGVPGAIIGIIMGLLSAYFFTSDHEKVKVAIKKVIPGSVLERIRSMWKEFLHVVVGYFKAQIKIMVVIYVVMLIALLILRVDYAPLVALGIAFLDMLPVFGTGTVLWPWALVKALSGDYKMAIILMVIYAVTQLMHHLLQPKMVGDSIGLAPLPTLFLLFIGYKIGGILGMLIALPIGMILINMYRKGFFDLQINGLKELIHDFNVFRKGKGEE